MASKEEKYKEQLMALGVYEPAFDAAIKELCILEREMSRARHNLKAKHTNKDTKKVDDYAYFTDDLYPVVKQIQSAVLAYKDALGLTPKALKKLKKKSEEIGRSQEASESVYDRINKRRNERKSNSTA